MAVVAQPIASITARSGIPSNSITVAAVCLASCNRPLRILKDTIIWGLLTGFALLFKATDVKSVGFFRDTALRTIGLSAFVEFFINIESFHLVLELILQLVLILVFGMLAVASNDEDQRHLKRLLEGFVTLVGAILIVTTAWKLGQS